MLRHLVSLAPCRLLLRVPAKVARRVGVQRALTWVKLTYVLDLNVASGRYSVMSSSLENRQQKFGLFAQHTAGLADQNLDLDQITKSCDRVSCDFRVS